MNTLVVRSLTPADVFRIQSLRHLDTGLDMQRGDGVAVTSIGLQLISAFPLLRGRARIFVASLDGRVVAAVSVRQQQHRYRWDIVSMAASDDTLDLAERDRNGIWVALLEFAIGQAGQAGAKRLFASADQQGPEYDGLCSASFEPYARFYVLRGTLPNVRDEPPEGFRRQDESDVWSIHHLYHHITPPVVQYAEALTSAAWEWRAPSGVASIMSNAPRSHAYVIETTDGIAVRCVITRSARGVVARVLADERYRHEVYPIVIASAQGAGLHAGEDLRVIIPAYASDLMSRFTDHSFTVESERVALIRHTTAPAIIRSRAVTPLAEIPERVPSGVPTYCRYCETVTGAPIPAPRGHRLERIAS